MPSAAGIDRPFPNFPASDRYLAIGSIEDARSRICRMIERGECLGVVVGPPGTGKTLLCQRIASQYRATHTVVMLGDIRVSSRMGLIQQVLFHLRLPHQGLDEQAMQLSLVECLTKCSDGARSLLLLVDEAQMLSLELLDELRMLSNLVRDGRPLVQTILVGNSRLEDPLADPSLESLSQRIAARCYLHPMTQTETSEYIRSMLATTGMPIVDDAVASVHHACGGVPRLINHLMNQSLDFACLHRKKSIDDQSVQHAWADLQQLPSPVVEPRLKAQPSAIEFGELDSDEMVANESAPLVYTIEAEESASELSAADIYDFQTYTDSVSANYVDIEAILLSPIVCSPEGSPELLAEAEPVAATEPVKVHFKTTNTNIPIPVTTAKRQRTASRAELFGIDFSDELLVDVNLANAVLKRSPTLAPVAATKPDPASEEISLHAEILQMSSTAKLASETRPVTVRAALPWAPAARIAEETVEVLPKNSADIAVPMAIVWSDDEPATPTADDRDILVIEDEVTVMVDPPATSRVGSAALRQPAAQVDQQYQSLFSRLRSNQ